MSQGTHRKRSTARPYEGSRPYLFVSYCHKDRRFVLPMIERLTRDGYRIWYDEGITPGSEWSEVIANHMNRAALCVAFLSENAVASRNCRREISFALVKNKPLLSIFLEDTVLSPGMEMQLTANQCVDVKSYPDVETCLEAVKSTPGFDSCLGEADASVVIGRYDEEDEPNLMSYILLRKSTGEEISLDDNTLYIGREAEAGQNSYVITGNYEIGRKHLVIRRRQGVYHVLDRKSKNHTYQNGVMLEPERESELKIGDSIRISSEVFVFQKRGGGGDGS